MANVYIFPYLRKGISCSITSSGTNKKNRADVPITLGVQMNNVSTNENKTHELEGQIIQLMGPADVKSISSRAINMISPPENSEVRLFKDYMPFIEFYEEDLPWRYTPVKTDDADFHPWMALIAVKEDEVEFKTLNGGTKQAIIKVTSEDRYKEIFPDKDLLSKLAHVQIDSNVPVNSNNINSLLDENPDCGISRILCASKLEIDTSYVAILIPAYKLGRLAGLGQSVSDVLLGQCAWEDTLADQSKQTEGLTFPYYKKWKFRTSIIIADFKTLASRLFFTPDEEYEHMKAFMDVDISQSGLNNIHYNYEEVIDVPAVLTLDFKNPVIRQEDKDYTNSLHELLKLNPVLKENETGEINMDNDPWVVPPIYGARHLLTTQSDFVNDKKDVVKEVNLELKNRIVAGLGSSIVKKNQEEFVHRAWKKVEKINQINQAIREYSQMLQVDNKASNKYKSHDEPRNVKHKDKALLLDVAQRSLQTAGIYRNQVSADRLLSVSEDMPKVNQHNQKVSCGLTVNNLKEIYSFEIWYNLLNKKELRNQLANNLDFFDIFPDYDLLSTLGFKVAKGQDNLFYFKGNSQSLSTATVNSIIDKYYVYVKIILYYYNNNNTLLHYGEIKSLLNATHNKKELFSRTTLINNKIKAIPIHLEINGDIGIVVPDMKPFKAISNDKPIKIEYVVNDTKDSAIQKRYYYILPLDYVKKQKNATYKLTSPTFKCTSYTNSHSIHIATDKHGNFVKADIDQNEEKWWEITKTQRSICLIKLIDTLNNHNEIRFNVNYKTDEHSNIYIATYENKYYIINHNGFNFVFSVYDKCFKDVIKTEGKINVLDCKKMAKILDNMMMQMELLEWMIWEPSVVSFSNLDNADFETITAEKIIKTIPYEPLLDSDVDPTLSTIRAANDYINQMLNIELEADEALTDYGTEIIDPNKLGDERIDYIISKYGYTEDNQIKENVDSKYPVMAYTDFLDPTFFYLREISPNYVIPSSGSLLKNSITYFRTNAKFEEAFLMGANTEMGHELLWREYPTDQRGSYFRKFWDQESLPTKDRLDDYYDIKQIHKWDKALGKNHMEGKNGMLVFAIRGELMQFYPNTRVYLSIINGDNLQISKTADMTSWLSEEIFLVGFENLNSNQLKGYYLTFEQEPLSLQFERKKGQYSIHGEFAIPVPHIYAIPLENRN